MVAGEQRLTWAFRRAVSREPKPQEAKVLTHLLEKHRSEYGKDRDSGAVKPAWAGTGCPLHTWPRVAQRSESPSPGRAS